MYKERTRTLFVSNFSHQTNLEERFRSVGPVAKIYYKKDCVMYVEYYDIRDTEIAQDKYHNKIVGGKKLRVYFSVSGCETDTICVYGSDCIPNKNKIRKQFERFGGIKRVGSTRNNDKFFVEFYDTRCVFDAIDYYREDESGIVVGVANNNKQPPQKDVFPREEIRKLAETLKKINSK